MEQYYRLPQDVVGHDAALLSYWDQMPAKAQLRLLESSITVSTLGELKMLAEHFARGSPTKAVPLSHASSRKNNRSSFFFDTYPGCFLRALPFALAAGVLFAVVRGRKTGALFIARTTLSTRFACGITELLDRILFEYFIG